MYKTIIFDFFGVIHSDPAKRWFDKHSIERAGEYADIFNQLDYGYIDQTEAYDRLNELSGVPVAEIKQVFGSTDMIDPEVIKIIRNLKSNYKIGILSNSTKPYLKNILDKNNLVQDFDHIIASSDIGIIKPDPQIFHIALDIIGATAEESIFIDDSSTNVAAANELKITSLLFESNEKLTKDLALLGLS